MDTLAQGIFPGSNLYSFAIDTLASDIPLERGSKTRCNTSLFEEVEKVSQFLKQLPPSNCRDGREARCLEHPTDIHLGEVVLITTNQTAIIGNHVHSKRNQVVIVTNALGKIHMRQSNPDGGDAVDTILEKHDITILRAGNAHAFNLPTGSELLVFCSTGWLIDECEKLPLDRPLLSLPSLEETEFHKQVGDKNPYDITMEFMGDTRITEETPVCRINDRLLVIIGELFSSMLRLPIQNERDGRTIRFQALNDGEITLVSSTLRKNDSENETVVVGNHYHETKKEIFFLFGEKVLFVNQHVDRGDSYSTLWMTNHTVTQIEPRQVHSFILPRKGTVSHLLIINSKNTWDNPPTTTLVKAEKATELYNSHI